MTVARLPCSALDAPDALDAPAAPPVAALLREHLAVVVEGAFSAADCARWIGGVYAARAGWVADFGAEQFTLGMAWYTHLEQDRTRAYFSLDGSRHGRPLLAGCGPDDERRVADFLVWPTLLLSVQPDYLLTYQLVPLSPRQTRVTASIFFAADAFPGEPCHAPDVYALWDAINLQDRRICERQQLGVESRGFRGGRYATVENGMHLFDQMVVRAYGLAPAISAT